MITALHIGRYESCCCQESEYLYHRGGAHGLYVRALVVAPMIGVARLLPDDKSLKQGWDEWMSGLGSRIEVSGLGEGRFLPMESHGFSD